MITVIENKNRSGLLNGTELHRGKAYKLVSVGVGDKGFVGSIYIVTKCGRLVNVGSGSDRHHCNTDFYVEVDLEIHVKEKC